jgi:hypothetical protein
MASGPLSAEMHELVTSSYMAEFVAGDSVREALESFSDYVGTCVRAYTLSL